MDGRENHGKAPLCADQGPTFPDLRILCRIRTSERGKSCERSSLLLFCLLFFGTALSSVYHRPIVEEGRIEKWDSLMFLHSPALLLTADVEDCRLEIGYIIS